MILRYRNVSGEERFVPSATPQTVPPGALFDVPESAGTLAGQSWCELIGPVGDEAGSLALDPAVPGSDLIRARTAERLAAAVRDPSSWGDWRNRTDREQGRRRGSRGAPTGMPPGVAIHFTCSGGGQHATTRLGSLILSRHMGGKLHVIAASRSGDVTAEHWVPGDDIGGTKYRIRCPRCRRDKPLSTAKALEGLLPLVEADPHQVTVDIAPARRKKGSPAPSA